MRVFPLFLLLPLLFLGSGGSPDPNMGRPMCNAYDGGGGERSWGAHNVLPNLYRHVYQPFLDAFTYTAMCKQQIPVACEKVLSSGSFAQRCEHIGATGIAHHYIVILQWLTGGSWNLYNYWPFSRDAAFDTSLLVTKECGNIVRKGDASFQAYRECRRATLMYQCAWHDGVWIAMPLALITVLGFVVLVTSCVSACTLLNDND